MPLMTVLCLTEQGRSYPFYSRANISREYQSRCPSRLHSLRLRVCTALSEINKALCDIAGMPVNSCSSYLSYLKPRAREVGRPPVSRHSSVGIVARFRLTNLRSWTACEKRGLHVLAPTDGSVISCVTACTNMAA